MVKRLILALPPLVVALAPLAAQTRQPPPFSDVAGRFLRDMQSAGEQAAGEALAQWIWASRNDAIKAGVSPIPPAIRAKLKGYFPEALLARVRYRIGTGNDFSLQANAFKGDAVAITLDEVILFRPGKTAADNLSTNANLWAHELTHVQQYARWGVRGFARRYTLDYQSVETEAEAGARKFAATRTAPPSGR